MSRSLDSFNASNSNSNNNNGGNVISEPLSAYYIGVFMKTKINYYLNVQAELQFRTIGNKGGIFPFTFVNRKNEISLPILLHLGLEKISIGIGPEVGYVHSAFPSIRNTNLSATGSFSFNITDKFTIEARYVQGLVRVFKSYDTDDNGFDIIGTTGIRFRSYQLGFNYHFFPRKGAKESKLFQ